jgi:LmbE family N-acetylglucosaminyl deacetylase
MSDRYVREPAQVSALREALQKCRDHIVLHDDEGLAIHSDLIQAADAALTATDSTAAECRKKIENEVLERAARHFEAMGDGKEMFATTVAFELTAMKG